jgi:hypothetical protein
MYGPIRLFIGLRDSTRRVLPELRRLDRYERRAAARRDRAVLDLLVEQIEQQLLVAKRAIFSPILMACETSGCREAKDIERRGGHLKGAGPGLTILPVASENSDSCIPMV